LKTWVCLALGLGICAQAYELKLEASTQFGVVRLQAQGLQQSLQNAADSSIKWLSQFEKAYTNTGKLDQILTRAPKGAHLRLDSLSYSLLDFGEQAYHRTGGKINVGMGDLIRAWRIGWGQKSRVPSTAELDSLVRRIQVFPYQIQRESRTVVVLDSGRHMVFGAFLEGRALEELDRRLRTAQAQEWLLEYSGDFRFSPTKSDGSHWRLGIKDPRNPNQILGVVQVGLAGMTALSTSGSYEQTFVDSLGVRHHHIFDPQTGQSTRGPLSVTVLAKNSLESDLMDTYLMTLSLSETERVYREAAGAWEAVIVQADGTLWVSPGLRPWFHLGSF
jgi:FAD:protein FMN transferase